MKNPIVPEIIIAEDDPLSYQVVATLLRFLKLDADHAWNGAQLIEKLNRKRYDFIFLDLNMPEMDGLTAAGMIRRGETNIDHRNVYITALSSEMLYYAIPACRQHAINSFIEKPLTTSKLKSVINSCGLFKTSLHPAGSNRKPVRARNNDLIDLSEAYFEAV